MRDSMGKLPKTKTIKEDLDEILRIATDKRSHVLYEDAYKWLQLKMKAIVIFANRGILKLKKENEK